MNCKYLLSGTGIFYVCLLATGELERSKQTTFIIAICTKSFTCAVEMLAFIYLLTFHTHVRPEKCIISMLITNAIVGVTATQHFLPDI
jgi:hypothetical protein